MYWDSYFLCSGEAEIRSFWADFYKIGQAKRKVIFILGDGFDPRMLRVLKILTDMTFNIELKCYLVGYPYNTKHKYQSLVDKNESELRELSLSKRFILDESIKADFSHWLNGIKEIVNQIAGIEVEYGNTDLILDVSAFPRAIYFNVLRTLVTVFGHRINIFASVSEQVDIDNAITENSYNEPEPLWGFNAKIGRASRIGGFNVALPLLGEGKKSILMEIIKKFPVEDTYPVLPFPSKNPRRSDDLLIEYQEELSNYLNVNSNQIIYAAEQNPFELYRMLSEVISNYRDSFKPLTKNVCFLVPILTSKLLSLGALLLALENKNDVAIFCPTPSNYLISKDCLEHFAEYSEKSEPFLMWITGEAYNE